MGKFRFLTTGIFQHVLTIHDMKGQIAC